MASPLCSRQPFKAIFIAAFIAKLPFELTFVALKYLFKPLRPQPAWSWRRSLLVHLTKLSFQLFAGARLQRTVYNEPSRAKERCAQVEIPAASILASIVGASEAVQPALQEAVWFPSPPPPAPDTTDSKHRVVLYFPAGAYVIAFGHESVGPEVHHVMAEHFNATRTVWAQYRLSDGADELRFPAALQDVAAFYLYVLSCGFKPEDIILAGDSAGGNLVLALLRHLEGIQGKAQSLPLPRGAVVISPWVNIPKNAGQHYDQIRNSRSDLLWGPLLQWGAGSYRPRRQPSPEVEAYISPLHHPFKLSVPLGICDGRWRRFMEK